MIKLRRERLENLDEEESEEDEDGVKLVKNLEFPFSETDKNEDSPIMNPLKSPDGSEARYNMLKGLVKGQLEDSPDMHKSIKIDK